MSKCKYLRSLGTRPHEVTIIPVTQDKWGTITEGASRNKYAYVEESVFVMQTTDGGSQIVDATIIFDGEESIDLNDEISFNSKQYKVMRIEYVRGMRNEIVETEVLAGRTRTSSAFRA